MRSLPSPPPSPYSFCTKGPAPRQPPAARPHGPHSNRAPLLPSVRETGAGTRGDVKAEEGGGARRPGNVGQGGWRGWRGSGLGGGQSHRAAASALGNIVFSWLEAQDMHSAWAPPPNLTTAVLSRSQRFLERGLGGRGPPPPPPGLALGPGLGVCQPFGLCPAVSGAGFLPSPYCTHRLARCPAAGAGELGGPGSASEQAPLPPPGGPLRSLNLWFLWQQKPSEGGGAAERMGVG